MVLIKPPQACSTAEVYKVIQLKPFIDVDVIYIFHFMVHLCETSFYFQRLRLDQTSKVDPLALLDKLSSNGISQDICVNDLGNFNR